MRKLSKRLIRKGWTKVNYVGQNRRPSDFNYARNKLGNSFTLMVYNGKHYLLYHSPPLYALLSVFHIKRFQRFKAYQLTNDEAGQLNSKVRDKDFPFLTEMSHQVHQTTRVVVYVVCSMLILLGGFMVMMDWIIGSIPWFLAMFLMRWERVSRDKNCVQSRIGKSLDELEYDYFSLKIKKQDDSTPFMRYLFPILAPMAIVALSQPTVWEGTTGHLWEVILAAVILVALLMAMDRLIAYPSSIREVNKRVSQFERTETIMYVKEMEDKEPRS